MKIKDYTLFTGNGKSRKATKVILPDGKEIRFLVKLSQKRAIREAQRSINHDNENKPLEK